MDLETQVKLYIYRTIVETTSVPLAFEVADGLDLSADQVQLAFLALGEKRLLVLEPDRPDRIRMAPPFSGIPTAHLVQVGGRSYFANCAWDAFGVSAALGMDADITSTCPDCGDLINIPIRNFRPVDGSYLAHFAVPAANWWDDIVYT